MSNDNNNNRGRGTPGRGRDNGTTPVPLGRGRGRGQPPVQDESAGPSGSDGKVHPEIPLSLLTASRRALARQHQTGPPPRGGTRNVPIRGGGWNNNGNIPTRQGAGGSAQGGARAAAAAYEASRRQRAAEDKARIQTGRQSEFSPKTFKSMRKARVTALSSSN